MEIYVNRIVGMSNIKILNQQASVTEGKNILLPLTSFIPILLSCNFLKRVLNIFLVFFFLNKHCLINSFEFPDICRKFQLLFFSHWKAP